MGISTDGIICFGVSFEEGYDFPWGDDVDEWWLKQQGFKLTFYPYTEDGEYKDGVEDDDPRIDAYYEERRQFRKDFGEFPFEIVNYCSCDYPMEILAIKSSVIQCSRGAPEHFNPDLLKVTDEEVKELLGFIEKHDLEPEMSKPIWMLCSYWG